MLTLKERRAQKTSWPAVLRAEISTLKSVAESCSRQIRAWADTLQNSDIKGQRHLNDRVRAESGQKQKVVGFQQRLLRQLPPTHPLRREAEERGKIGDLKSEISNLKFRLQNPPHSHTFPTGGLPSK